MYIGDHHSSFLFSRPREGLYGGVTPSNPTIVAAVYLPNHGAETDDLLNFLLLGLSFVILIILRQYLFSLLLARRCI